MPSIAMEFLVRALLDDRSRWLTTACFAMLTVVVLAEAWKVRRRVLGV